MAAIPLGRGDGKKTAVPTLTKRQKELADLVSQGLTNREIAQRLGIDERSAEGHVERIRNRLGVRSRAQITTWWVAHGPKTEVVLRLTSGHCPCTMKA
jgi:DNA-binding CsgD family transcriptional regulator